jgi:prepilin-type N-terminal cleavage/methylation domain-containing protein
VVVQAPRLFHLSHRERSKSSFMISGEGFSPLPTFRPHPESAAQILTSPDGRGNAHAPRLSHLSHRERSASNARRVRACLPTIRPHPESAALSCRLHDGIRSCPSDQTPSCDGVTSGGGFSLIELAIVLVILGLLVGGIMTGQSLIRAAELRSVTTESNRYFAAIQTFRDKYFALPGDMTNATAFWGKDTTSTSACASASGTAATPGTCNGNGNGWIGSNIFENYRSWQHLALAGLIEGSYSGLVDPAAWTTPPTPGIAVPKSKLNNAYWLLAQLSQNSAVNGELGYSDLPDVRYNWLLVSGVNSTYWTGGSLLKPEEAWNIDTKMDDGLPGTGKARSGSNSPNCATTTVSTTAVYALTNSSVNCTILGFLLN